MTIKEIEAHELATTEKNAWCIAEDVRSRIDNEPGPGKCYMLSFLTPQQDEQLFFNSQYLEKWRKSGIRARINLPGRNYFNGIEGAIKLHYERGELYMQYKKNTCSKDNNDSVCDICTSKPTTGPEAVQCQDPSTQPTNWA